MSLLVLVNHAAGGGRARARWERVEAGLRGRGAVFDVRVTESEDELPDAVAEAARDGRDAVVAAGGDGTVHALLNALVDAEAGALRHPGLALGAIGLGSSNDFHKPFAPERTLEAVPIRIDPGAAASLDVGRAEIVGPDGEVTHRAFLLNTSLGFIAIGNAFFNEGDRVLRLAKRLHTEVAILYTALRNLATFRPLEARLALDDGEARPVRAAAISVIKRNAFAGGMRYDSPVTPDDGRLGVQVWGRASRLGIVSTMASLYQGRFAGRPGSGCHVAERVRVETDAPEWFELDGEVRRVREVRLSVMPRVLRVCG